MCTWMHAPLQPNHICANLPLSLQRLCQSYLRDHLGLQSTIRYWVNLTHSFLHCVCCFLFFLVVTVFWIVIFYLRKWFNSFYFNFHVSVRTKKIYMLRFIWKRKKLFVSLCLNQEDIVTLFMGHLCENNKQIKLNHVVLVTTSVYYMTVAIDILCGNCFSQTAKYFPYITSFQMKNANSSRKFGKIKKMLLTSRSNNFINI